MFDCAPVFCLPACFFPLRVVFVVLCFVIKKTWFPLHLSPRPHLSWHWSLFSPDFPLSPPALTLLSPSAEALKERKATLVCLAEDISVALVHVTWSVNGRSVTDGVWSSPTEKQQDKTFKMSSYLTIESSDWKDDADFSCEVSVGSKFTKKSISVSQCWKTVWIKISDVLSLFLFMWWTVWLQHFISVTDYVLKCLVLILQLKICEPRSTCHAAAEAEQWLCSQMD